MKRLSTLLVTSLMIGIALLNSCSTPQVKEDVAQGDENAPSVEKESSMTEDEFLMRLNMLVLNNLTTPISVIEDLKKEEGKGVYHADYVNSLDNVSKYDTKFIQSLNYGIYGLDIIYNVAHDHILDIKDYKDKTLPIAQTLGLESFYSDSDMNRFISFAGSHKSLNEFILDEYHRIDEYLVSHHSYKAALLSITGGIIESMYFTGKTVEEKGVTDLEYGLLVNEKHLINQLVPIYDYFSGDEEMDALKSELVKIQSDMNSFSTRDQLTEEVAKKLGEDILVLREKIVTNTL